MTAMMHRVAEASAVRKGPGSEVSEHVEAVVSGRLKQALLLTLLILVVELGGGVISHSLALLSDAGHVTTDIFALGLAWFAVKQTERPADEARSYGYHRAGILAAMTNGATLIVLVFVIAWEAAQRFVHPEPVQGGIVIVSAVVGVGVNAYVALLHLRDDVTQEQVDRPLGDPGRRDPNSLTSALDELKGVLEDRVLVYRFDRHL